MSTEYSPLNRDGGTGANGMVDPLLARLYHTRTKFESSQEDVQQVRRQLCDDMTSFMETSVKPMEREMVADILISLMKKADKTLKEAIADRLSAIPTVPLRLILQLVGEGIEVARPVLVNSPALNDLDLLYIIQSHDAAYWRTIATRPHLTENVVDALVDTDDTGTVGCLLDNVTAPFSDFALKGIEKHAVIHTDLIEKMLKRDDLPAAFTQKIYAYVGKIVEESINHAYGELSFDMREQIEDVVLEFAAPPTSPYMSTPAMTRAADMFMMQGKLTTLLMLRTLKRGQVASFVAQFSAFCRMPVPVILTMFDQRDRSGLAIAARGNGLTRQEFISILMLTSQLPGKTALMPEDIKAAAAYFDRISQKAADRLLQRSRH